MNIHEAAQEIRKHWTGCFDISASYMDFGTGSAFSWKIWLENRGFAKAYTLDNAVAVALDMLASKTEPAPADEATLETATITCNHQ